MLNEAERTYSSALRKPHGNAKRVYPFWKTCQVCSQPYPCLTKEQAARNRTCSPACNAAANSARPRKRKPRPRCGWCQQEFTPKSRRSLEKALYCCPEHAGKARATDPAFVARMRAIASTGRSGWTEASAAAYSQKMTGPANPAWKGGVTYFRKKGNYAPVKYVRCPPAFAAMARKDGYVMEHRLLVAQAIGRCLLRAEVVHHDNHDPQDNRLENLMLFASNSAHKRYERHGSPAPIWRGSSPSSTAA